MRSPIVCILALSLLVGTSTGCVTGTRSIELSEPSFPMTVAISSGSVVLGEISDRRQFKDGSPDPAQPSVRGGLEGTTPEQRTKLIGRQRNGYGKALAGIDLPDGRTVQDEVQDLLAYGLAGRGYEQSASAATKIDVEIQKFWTWLQPGMWAISFNAEVRTKLLITTSEGVQEVTVEGKGVNNGQVASDANWALAYRRAYDDYLEQLEITLEEAGY